MTNQLLLTKYKRLKTLATLSYMYCKVVAESRFEYGNPIYGDRDYVKVYLKKSEWKAIRALVRIAEGNKDAA